MQHTLFAPGKNVLYPRDVEVKEDKESSPSSPVRFTRPFSDSVLLHRGDEESDTSAMFEWDLGERFPVTGLDDRPSARYGHSAVAVGDRYLYYIGGQDAEDRRLGEIWRYDTRTNEFLLMGIKGPHTMPNFARHVSGTIQVDGGVRILSFGGYDFSKFCPLPIYDPAKNTWTFPDVSGDEPPLRSNHAWARIGEEYVLFGGSLGSTDSNYEIVQSSFVLDVENHRWTRLNSHNMPSKRVGHVMISMGNALYMFGGGVWSHEHSWEHQYNSLYVYTREDDRWREITSFNRPPCCTYTYAFSIGTNLCFFGGACIRTGNVTKKIYMFDTVSERWSRAIKVSNEETLHGRSMGTATVVGNDVFIFGGFSGGVLHAQDFIALKAKFDIAHWSDILH